MPTATPVSHSRSYFLVCYQFFWVISFTRKRIAKAREIEDIFLPVLLKKIGVAGCQTHGLSAAKFRRLARCKLLLLTWVPGYGELILSRPRFS
jgi:hypothetical protein